MTKEEAADLLERFVKGGIGDYEFDDFLIFRHKDPLVFYVASVVSNIDHDYPPDKPGYYCNEAGLQRLLELAALLREKAIAGREEPQPPDNA